MTTDIFIVTHRRDRSWLDWCVKSIYKFVAGFNQIVVLVPTPELSAFDSNGIKLVSFDQSPPPRGHIHHCLQKCMANKWCDADFILFVDSDCIFREPTSVNDYFVNGRPILLMESYSSLERQKNPALCWRSGTSEVLGFIPTHEFMRRHPAVHCRELFPAFKSHIERIHRMGLEQYALSCRPENPVGFNDFNNLGAFANRFMPDKYHFIDITHAQGKRPRDHLIQYWSHGAIDQPQERWLDGKCDSVIPIEEIGRLLL